MDVEQNGTQAQQQDTQQQEQQQAAQQSQQETQQGTQGAGQSAGDSAGASGSGAGANATTYGAQLAERDKRIAELEAQGADAAKTAEAAEALKREIAELKAQGESDRIDFKLQLAGVRNIKAARAVLDDHGGDIDKLKAEEPWLFADASGAQPGGRTGLPNAGTSSDEGKTMKRWRKLAGLDDTDNE